MALMPGLFSADKRNLVVAKGIGTIKREDESLYHHLGNMPSVVFTPSAETLEHFTSMEGIKLKDETITLTQGGEIKLTMEELTMRNLAIMVMGDFDDTDLNAVTVDIFSRESIVAAMKFFMSNRKGPRWYWDFTQVTFVPSGDIPFVSDSYGQMVATGSVEAVNGDFGTITLKGPVADAVPENILLPLIIHEHNPPQALDDVGIESAWVGASSFTYSWKRAGVAISGATSSTYTLTAPDVGPEITVTVTATNANGSTSATSPGITVGVTT